MAQNLRGKLPVESALYVCEINQVRCDAFAASTPENARALSSPKEVGKHSVSSFALTCDIQPLKRARQNVIFTILPKGEHVLEVFHNSELSLLAETYQDSRIFVSAIDVKTCEIVANLVSR